MSKPPIIHYEIGFATHQGLEKEINEDNYCAEHRTDDDGDGMCMLAVSDGIGGFSLGEIASKVAVNQVEKFFKLGEFRQMFEEAEFLEPQRVIQELYTKVNHVVMTLMEKENRPVGCTLVSGFFYGLNGYIASVGNSRAYVIRGKAMKKVTEDHFESMSESGLFGDDDNLQGQKSSKVNVLGSDIALKADITKVGLKDGDVFILCTDGLFSQLREDDIVNISHEQPTMQGLCNALVERANMMGGKDNVTVVALKVTATQPSIGDMVGEWRKDGMFSSPKVLSLIALIVILVGMGGWFLFQKIASTKSPMKRTPAAGQRCTIPGYPDVQNGLALKSEVPIKFVMLNEESRSIERRDAVFWFNRDVNEVQIHPNFQKMKSPWLYTIMLKGVNRNISVVQANKNRVVITKDSVTVNLTYGSKVDIRTVNERGFDMFVLKIDHLGSAYAVRMENPENIFAEIAVQRELAKPSPTPTGEVFFPVVNPSKSKPTSTSTNPGKPRSEPFNYRMR